MVYMEIDPQSARTIERAFANLRGNQIVPAIMAAQRRAITAGRMAGRKEIRSIYTIKAGEINKRATIKADRGALSTTLHIKGPFEPVSQYKVRENAHGVFVAIKRGHGGVVPRSFDINGRFVARDGSTRLPIHTLYGPAVPQLYGNAEVSEIVEKRSMEVYEQRLLHELEWRMGV
jgi:hypothetical protein